MPNGSWPALQREIQRKLGLIGEFEMINTNVLLLKADFPDRGLKPTKSKVGSTSIQNGWLSETNASMDQLAATLEDYLGVPVINETGLKHSFDFDIEWNDIKEGHDGLKQALINQAGLELVPAEMPIKMFVIEKSK
jgi:uncharacterized protein (TIGR03435 family)